MVAYVTWLDRDARQPFVPAEEFDEAVYDLEIDEPEGTDEPHAGDVTSGRTATNEFAAPASRRLLRARKCSTTCGRWSRTSNTSSSYDERSLIESLTDEQRAQLERNARVATRAAERARLPLARSRRFRPR